MWIEGLSWQNTFFIFLINYRYVITRSRKFNMTLYLMTISKPPIPYVQKLFLNHKGMEIIHKKRYIQHIKINFFLWGPRNALKYHMMTHIHGYQRIPNFHIRVTEKHFWLLEGAILIPGYPLIHTNVNAKFRSI